MLIHPLAERLRAVGMAAMAEAFLEMQSQAAATELTREDWLGLLLDREVTARDGKRLARRLSQARLRQNAVVEDTDFRAPRGLDRAFFHKLAGCDWLRQATHASPRPTSRSASPASTRGHWSRPGGLARAAARPMPPPATGSCSAAPRRPTPTRRNITPP